MKAQIDVGAEEIRFCKGTDNIFFRFQFRTKQKFIIHQAQDGTTIWGEPEPQLEETPVTPTH